MIQTVEAVVDSQPSAEGDLDDSHFVSRPKRMTAEEVVAWLAEMAAMSTGHSLPADWSRADIYDEDEPRCSSSSIRECPDYPPATALKAVRSSS